MIHRLIVHDGQGGAIVFDRGTISIKDELLVSLIKAMLLLSQELGKVEKGYLKEIEIGKYQISLLDVDGLTYILIIDTYDNELFVRRILNIVVERFHNEFKDLQFNTGIRRIEDLQDELASFIQTMNFPEILNGELENITRDSIIRLRGKVDLLLLTDLDEGISRVFSKPEWHSENLINVLMLVLSEIPLEKSWIGESKISERRRNKYRFSDDATYEGWIYQRIGLTEFILIARGFYDTTDRDKIILEIEELANQIHLIYVNWLISNEN